MRWESKRVGCLLLLFVLSACSPKDGVDEAGESNLSPSDAAFTADTNDYFERLESLGFAGGALIARGDQILLQAGYEMADREAGRPWSDDTIATIGSITKQFTGAAIMLLQEDGVLSVDDPITDYFPDVPEDKQTIMLHQLLTHSSGIVDLDGPGDWDPIDRETFIQLAMDQPLAFQPGLSFAYSNAGYSLLAAIIEQVTGGSYEAFVRERLFLPAGMNDTGYKLAGWDDARVAVGYEDGERWGTVLERPFAEDGPYWVLRGNGGIHSTTADMLRWAEALTSGTVLSSKSMEAYWHPHVDEGYGDSFYAYGWVVMQGPGDKRVIKHNGGNNVLFADMAIFPDDDVVIVLQTNVVADWPLADSLLEIIGARLFEGEAYPVVPALADIDSGELAPLAGRYVSGEGDERLEFSVTAEGNELLLSPGNSRTFAMLHSSRVIDLERSERLSKGINEIVAAYVERDDLGPLFDAYGGRAALENLEAGWQTRKRGYEDEFGALIDFSIFGTALRDGRDVTVARHLFENGHYDSAFVWDPDQDEHLLGRSSRGLDPELRFVPTGESRFGSWDGGFSDSRPLSFTNAGQTLTLGGPLGDIVANRVR
jgi:prepilin-type processing-associated H-X9-DG protein